MTLYCPVEGQTQTLSLQAHPTCDHWDLLFDLVTAAAVWNQERFFNQSCLVSNDFQWSSAGSPVCYLDVYIL